MSSGSIRCFQVLNSLQKLSNTWGPSAPFFIVKYFFGGKVWENSPNFLFRNTPTTFQELIKCAKRRDSMSAWLIIVTGLIYAYIAAEQGFKGNLPMCICYACYAGANVGLYMMATK